MSNKIRVSVAQGLDVLNFVKDVPNFINDTLHFVKDVPRGSKSAPKWETTSNH